MDAQLVTTVIVAVLSGGLLTEVFRSYRDRKKTDLDLFYPTWKEEIQRMDQEIKMLRAQVVALSVELQHLGGDPLAIRQAIETAETVVSQPKEKTNEG